MRGKVFVLGLVLTVLMAFCLASVSFGISKKPKEEAPPPVEEAAPAIDVAAEAQAIRDLSAQWMEAENARDGATISNLFAPNGTTIFDGEIHEGQAAIDANREEEWTENPDFTIGWTTTAVEVAASGDLAYERGTWTYDPDGPGEAAEESGEYVTVWKKMDGQWRVMVDAGTTVKAEEGVEKEEAPPEE